MISEQIKRRAFKDELIKNIGNIGVYLKDLRSSTVNQSQRVVFSKTTEKGKLITIKI